MRIVRLDLCAFGPFTNASLVFDDANVVGGGPKLHVVYGPNEAGKSSSLRALGQWLYGIPHSSTDNFIHPHTEMRIGGVVANKAGEQLAFIRRKGRSATLRAADDIAALEQAMLDKYLAGIEAATFQQKFGISHEELRRGGAALIADGGDVGESLFAAASGIAGLGAIQGGLEAEAAALFKPRGANQAINKAVKLHKAACDRIKEASLNPALFDERTEAYRKAEEKVSAIEDELQAARAEHRRWERIEQSLSHIATLCQAKMQLAEVAASPLLPADFSEKRVIAVAEFEAAQLAHREAQHAIDRLQADLAGLKIEPELLANRTAIESLHTDLGSDLKASKDRRRLAADAAACEAKVAALLADLGFSENESDRWRLPKTARQRLQAIGGDRQARIEKCESTSGELSRLRGRISQLSDELRQLPSPQDAGELERSIKKARQEGPLDKQLSERRREFQRQQQQFEVEFARLGLFSGALEDVETLATPDHKTLDRFETDLAALQQAIGRSAAVVQDADEKLESTVQEIETLRAHGEVPSEDELDRVRRERDTGWVAIERCWLGGASLDCDEVQAFFAGDASSGSLSIENLASRYRESVIAADAHADRLRHEARRVQRAASLDKQRQELVARREKALSEHAVAKTTYDDVLSQWRQVWEPLRVDPLPPPEMRSWLVRQQDLARSAESLRRLRFEVDDLEQRIRRGGEFLGDAASAVGVSLRFHGASLEEVIEASEAVAKDLKKAHDRRMDCERLLEELRRDLPRLESEANAATQALKSWQKEWKDAVVALNLSGDATFNEANAVVESMGELERECEALRKLRERIRGIEDDAAEFAVRVRSLIERAAPDLGKLTASEAVGSLYDRLQSAIQAETRRAAWDSQLSAEKAKRESARAMIEVKQQSIDAMCLLAGCASLDELPGAEERSSRRREIERRLRETEDVLRDLAAGANVDDWIAEVAGHDADAVHAQSQRLRDLIEHKDSEKVEAAKTQGALGKELELMDGGQAAADARFEAEMLLAEIRSDAEKYIRLKLASSVLRKSIERFREANQGPTLRRASDIFSQLTIGSFAGLRADYDDDGKAVLVGVRPDGKTVGVAGMSDGSCDQLYLALRLALLEAYLETREPMPFIVDDILIMFDEPRAVAALKALAELAKKTQVIFFTHHEHLVRLAQEHLPPASFSTHTLA